LFWLLFGFDSEKRGGLDAKAQRGGVGGKKKKREKRKLGAGTVSEGGVKGPKRVGRGGARGTQTFKHWTSNLVTKNRKSNGLRKGKGTTGEGPVVSQMKDSPKTKGMGQCEL